MRTAIMVSLALVALGCWTVQAARASSMGSENACLDARPDVSGLPPGTILARQRLDTPADWDARAWRILYASTDNADNPSAVCGLIVAPNNVRKAPIYAWAHGATGVVARCGITIDPDRTIFAETGAQLPTLEKILAQGFVVVFTDYQNLGITTDEFTPFLVGKVEGRNTLDAVRAVRNTELGTRNEFIVGGHSQGGHAALFAGQIVGTAYWSKDDPVLRGVVSLAPMAELKDLVEEEAITVAQLQTAKAGLVLFAMAWPALAQVYADYGPQPGLQQILSPEGIETSSKIDKLCLTDKEGWREMSKLTEKYAQDGGPRFYSTNTPTKVEPWKTLLELNTPGFDRAKIDVPIFMGQGLNDTTIDPSITAKAYTRYCGSLGNVVELVEYPGTGHLAVVAAAERDTARFMKEVLSGTGPLRCSKSTATLSNSR